MYGIHPRGGIQLVGVGGLYVGVAVGYTVTTTVMDVGLAVEVGGIVKVGAGTGEAVEVGVAWAGNPLGGAVVGSGKGVAVGLGGRVSGVNCAAIGVGSGG
jgi:hypothetical protein